MSAGTILSLIGLIGSVWFAVWLETRSDDELDDMGVRL